MECMCTLMLFNNIMKTIKIYYVKRIDCDNNQSNLVCIIMDSNQMIKCEYNC